MSDFSKVPNLTTVPTPAEWWAANRPDEEELPPPVTTRRGVEYYTGEFYGDR